MRMITCVGCWSNGFFFFIIISSSTTPLSVSNGNTAGNSLQMGVNYDGFHLIHNCGVVKLDFVLLDRYLSTMPIGCVIDVMTVFRRLHSYMYELGTASKHSNGYYVV